MAIFIFFFAHWYLALFTQTFLNHRYAAHNAFTMSPFWERVSYIFAYIFQGTSYLSPNTYAIMHRMHHAYTDTEQDPHSPKFDKNLFAMMWRTKKVYAGIRSGTLEVEDRFKKNLTDWPKLDNLGHSGISRLLWGAFYVAFYVHFASSPWLYLLLPVHFFMGPIHGAIINWFAHKTGFVNFKMTNTSKNLMPLDLFMMGEAYHNNHHKHPSRINFGVKWQEIDPVYPIILLFNWMGIVRITKETQEAPIS
jgi:stearoyl-CoA desaturase (Delta-9 desaturase)